jgi:hypothetical protein
MDIIKRIHVDGAFLRPNGIFRYSKRPTGDTTAVFSMCASYIGML